LPADGSVCSAICAGTPSRAHAAAERTSSPPESPTGWPSAPGAEPMTRARGAPVAIVGGWINPPRWSWAFPLDAAATCHRSSAVRSAASTRGADRTRRASRCAVRVPSNRPSSARSAVWMPRCQSVHTSARSVLAAGRPVLPPARHAGPSRSVVLATADRGAQPVTSGRSVPVDAVAVYAQSCASLVMATLTCAACAGRDRLCGAKAVTGCGRAVASARDGCSAWGAARSRHSRVHTVANRVHP
jgi:hypothetical protein